MCTDTNKRLVHTISILEVNLLIMSNDINHNRLYIYRSNKLLIFKVSFPSGIEHKIYGNTLGWRWTGWNLVILKKRLGKHV